MDPMTAALMMGVPAVAALIGRLVAQGDVDKANALRQKAVDQYGQNVLPQLDQQIARQQGATSYGQIQEDPTLRNAETSALSQLQDEYNQGGMTQADKSAMQLAESNAAGRAQSDYQSAANGMAARGQGNNPALMAALQSQVGASSAHAVGNMEAQSQIAARQRALQALEGSASLAGNIRGQDYRLSGDTASAQDRINQYNTSLQSGADQYNLHIPQQQYENQMGLDAARTAAMNAQANGYMASAGATEQTAAGVGNAITSGIAGYDSGKKKPTP